MVTNQTITLRKRNGDLIEIEIPHVINYKEELDQLLKNQKERVEQLQKILMQCMHEIGITLPKNNNGRNILYTPPLIRQGQKNLYFYICSSDIEKSLVLRVVVTEERKIVFKFVQYEKNTSANDPLDYEVRLEFKKIFSKMFKLENQYIGFDTFVLLIEDIITFFKLEIEICTAIDQVSN